MTGRLPAVDAKRAIRALRKAGFVVDRVAGSHYLLVDPNNPARAVTVPYHGQRDLKPGTLRSILRQAGLSTEEFARLL
jgi:predicted RNA binding protein YcfA (HicA-like mRNA interferase family)